VVNDESNLRPARAQLAEPPYAVVWEGATAPPIPIASENAGGFVSGWKIGNSAAPTALIDCGLMPTPYGGLSYFAALALVGRRVYFQE
jgi:hypothetical protein